MKPSRVRHRPRALDASGNVHVTGYFGRNLDVGPSIALGGALLPSAGLTDLFVASYSADGAHRASRTYGTRRRDEGAGIAVDANGDVLVTGLFASPRDDEAGDTVDFGSGPITATSTHDAFLTRLAP